MAKHCASGMMMRWPFEQEGRAAAICKHRLLRQHCAFAKERNAAKAAQLCACGMPRALRWQPAAHCASPHKAPQITWFNLTWP